jgi:F-type H+-transporting ATPase subunit epsilon
MADLTARVLTVSVVSADSEIWSGKAKQLIAKTTVGEIGILAGHEPILATLAPGQVRVTTVDGQLVTTTAEDGFISVEHDTVTIVARNAELLRD